MRHIKLIMTAMLVFGPIAANADVIEVTGAGANNGFWDVSLVDGSFDSLETLLTQQVWWGDVSLAVLFADVLGAVAGVNNAGLGLGPFFGEGVDADFMYFAAWSNGDFFTEGAGYLECSPVDACRQGDFTWATAARVNVPEPATLALLGLGLAGMGMSRRRRKTASV